MGDLFKQYIVNQIASHLSAHNARRITALQSEVERLKRSVDGNSHMHKISRRFLSAKEDHRIRFQPVAIIIRIINFLFSIAALTFALVALTKINSL